MLLCTQPWIAADVGGAGRHSNNDYGLSRPSCFLRFAFVSSVLLSQTGKDRIMSY